MKNDHNWKFENRSILNRLGGLLQIRTQNKINSIWIK